MIDLSDASNSASRNDTTRTDLAVTVPPQTVVGFVIGPGIELDPKEK